MSKQTLKTWSSSITKITDESIFAEAEIVSKNHGSCKVFVCGATPEEALEKRSELYSIVGKYENVVKNDDKQE